MSDNGMRLGFGMLRLPVVDGDNERPDMEKVCELVDEYLSLGGTYFDTSFVYHGGHSEEATRKAVVERHPRDSFQLTTKMPAGSITGPAHMRETFERQLANLGTDRLDRYLIHNVKGWLYDQKVRPFGMFEFAAEQRAAGRIGQLGFSFHDCPADLERILSEHPEVDFVQVVVNYFDWEGSWVRSRECYEVARAHGKDVIVMEPVKGGMLAHPPADLAAWMEREQPGSTPASWAFRFAAGLDGVVAVLSGMNTLAQVRENCALASDMEPLTAAQREALVASHGDYLAMAPLGLSDFERFPASAADGMPVREVLENYDLIRLQRGYGTPIAAENNYYHGLRYRAGVTTGPWLRGEVADRDGNDVTELVREAEGYFLSDASTPARPKAC